MMLLNARRLLNSTAGCCLQHQAQYSPCMGQWLGCVHVDAAKFHAGGHRNLATQPGPAGSFMVRLMSTSPVFDRWSVLIDGPGGALQHAYPLWVQDGTFIRPGPAQPAGAQDSTSTRAPSTDQASTQHAYLHGHHSSEQGQQRKEQDMQQQILEAGLQHVVSKMAACVSGPLSPCHFALPNLPLWVSMPVTLVKHQPLPYRKSLAGRRQRSWKEQGIWGFRLQLPQCWSGVLHSWWRCVPWLQRCAGPHCLVAGWIVSSLSKALC